jgi:DNA primase
MLSSADIYNEVIENSSEEDLILDSHKKIYSLISENINYDYDERVKRIDLKCDDIESSKEFVNILELELIYEDDYFKQLIRDYVREIKKYKLEESKKQIMNEIKLYESQGRIEESLKLAPKLVQIQKEIGRL